MGTLQRIRKGPERGREGYYNFHELDMLYKANGWIRSFQSYNSASSVNSKVKVDFDNNLYGSYVGQGYY